jgi:hypothetical protein
LIKNDLDKRSNDFGTYDDGRDDKSSEPESVVVAKMGSKDILLGLEEQKLYGFMI